MTEPRAHSRVFGQFLHDVLSGVERPIDSPDAALQLFSSESAWLRTHYQDAIDKLHKIDASRTGYAFGELRFHMLNSALLYMWSNLLMGTAAETTAWEQRQAVRLMQTGLAVQAMKAYARRRKLPAAPPHALPTEQLNPEQRLSRQMHALYDGLLTETDAGIVGLEFIVDKPGLLWLPAPPQFERGSNEGSTERNVDYIAINSYTDMTVGTSVKTRAKDNTTYDRSRVVVIDGDNDLDNVVYVKKPGFSRRQRETRPGLISAGYLTGLSAAKGNEFRSRMGERDYTIARLMARQLIGGAKPRLDESVKHIGYKLRPHLGL